MANYDPFFSLLLCFVSALLLSLYFPYFYSAVEFALREKETSCRHRLQIYTCKQYFLDGPIEICSI
jgi:hypothetical protein